MSDGLLVFVAKAQDVVRTRVPVRGVDPAVEAPAHVVDDGVRVAIAEVGVELGAFVGLVVAVRVLKEPHIRRGADDDAVFVKHAARGELDLVGKDGLFVHDAVAIRVGEDGDAIERFAVVVAGLVGAAVLPRVHIRLAEAVRILRRLDDPQAAFFIPVDVHGLVDERLGGDEAQIELGMHFERLRQLLRARAAALDVAQRIAQFGRLAQFVDVFPLSGPGDATQDQGADADVAEIAMVMTGDAGEGAVGGMWCSRPGCGFFRSSRDDCTTLTFISPHLRLDVVDVHGLLFRHGLGGAGLGFFVATFELRSVRRVGGGEDLGFGQQIHVVVDFVVDVEVADVLGDRVVVIGEIEAHRGLQPLRLPKVPRTADDGLEPVVILRHRRRVDDDQTAATGEELHQILPLIANLDVSSLLRVQDEHVRLVELLLRWEFHAALALGAAFIEHRHPFLEKLREIMRTGSVGFFTSADEDAERRGRES